MHPSQLDDVRVIAERVQRFADDVERSGTEADRARWRAALEDLKDAIRAAREAGWPADAVLSATEVDHGGRFTRATGRPAPAPQDVPEEPALTGSRLRPA